MGLTGSQKALMFCQANVERCAASRTGYYSSHAFITIGGVQYGYAPASTTNRVILSSLTITDALDQEPNTCTCLVKGVAPTIGAVITVLLGSTNMNTRLFAGHILSVDQSYLSKPANPVWQIHAIDYTWLLNRRKVTKRYTADSASTIAQSLISTYTSGFTVVNVQASLATINEITFTNQNVTEALTNLARRIGAYWYIDYNKDLHFFTTDIAPDTDPTALTATHASLSDFAINTDLGQWITRVYCEGGGVNALAECAAGETIIPVTDTAWYQEAGGTVISGPQRLTYTGLIEDGGGTLVGPGMGPASAPVLTLAAGAGLGAGVYQYAYTDVTAVGESLPSPLGTVTTETFAAPAAIGAAFNYGYGSGNLTPLSTYGFAFTFRRIADGVETTKSPTTSLATDSHGLVGIPLSGCSTPPSGWARKWYHTVAGGATYKVDPNANELNNFGTEAGNFCADGTLGAEAPTSAQYQQVVPSGIALGPTGTTQRKIYRTAVGGSQLKLQQTIANNTATDGVQDVTADGALGANAPTSDTSGFTQPDGQVLAGVTSLFMAGTGAFASGGGWASIGNGRQIIRYTGITGNTLTGIPATGPGAITASVSYNSTATAMPALIGIPASGTGAILYTITPGDPINLLVQADNVNGQTDLAALIGGDGIQEDYLQDRRLSYTESLARANAQLTLRGSSAISVRYKCRDVNTKSGRPIVVNLAAPTSVSGTFKIQRVTISDFGSVPTVHPTYTVEASSVRFSFEDILRRIAGG